MLSWLTCEREKAKKRKLTAAASTECIVVYSACAVSIASYCACVVVGGGSSVIFPGSHHHASSQLPCHRRPGRLQAAPVIQLTYYTFDIHIGCVFCNVLAIACPLSTS